MAYTQIDEKRMMTTPNDWPRWPFLPVKRRDHNLQDNRMGVLIERAGKVSPTVYHVNLFDLPSIDLSKAKTTTFRSFEEMIQAGWIVD